MAARAESGRRDEDALMAGDVISVARGERSDDESRRAGEERWQPEAERREGSEFRLNVIYLDHVTSHLHLTLARWPRLDGMAPLSALRQGLSGCHALNLEP